MIIIFENDDKRLLLFPIGWIRVKFFNSLEEIIFSDIFTLLKFCFDFIQKFQFIRRETRRQLFQKTHTGFITVDWESQHRVREKNITVVFVFQFGFFFEQEKFQILFSYDFHSRNQPLNTLDFSEQLFSKDG